MKYTDDLAFGVKLDFNSPTGFMISATLGSVLVPTQSVGTRKLSKLSTLLRLL